MAEKKKTRAGKVKREYSRQFSPLTGEGRQFTIRRIPPVFWERVQKKAKLEGVSLRAHLLRFLEQWVDEGESDDGRKAVASGGHQ